MSDEMTVASDEEQEAPAAAPVDEAPEPAATETKAGEQPDLTPEELIAALEASFRDFKDGDIVEGEVVKIDRDEVLLDIGYKSEGVIPSKELSIRHDVDPRGGHAFRPDHHGSRDRGREGRADPGHRIARVPAGIPRRPAPSPRSATLRRAGARGEDHRARPEPQQRRAITSRLP